MAVFDKARLLAILGKIPESRILVFGDLMWDHYVRGDAARISPEAPVPVLLAESEYRTPGGAANVLKNLRALGCSIGVLGVVGDDANGRALVDELSSWTAGKAALLALADRPTTIKTRFIARNQQLLRVDFENARALQSTTEDEILRNLDTLIGSFSAIILSDYDKGLLTPRVIAETIRMAKAKGVLIAVDPQVKHFRQYVGCDVMTPNEKEASEGIGMPFPQSDGDVQVIADKIRSTLRLPHLLITRSQRGMAYFTENYSAYLPTVAREVYDVTGAGDTVISVYTAALVAGATHPEAMLLANYAGGIVVGKFGTATTTIAEIRQELEHPQPVLREVKN
ncbi:MAG: D-glycero-beta-D-manno-heptose-7-phosphate kinase [Turneriella sp.]|nr:D-glycero-beta-D-manno-heptose-7-phosphate kinase [Turneriella sp.]